MATLFISGSGFNFSYQLGAASYLPRIDDFDIYAGTSAGALLCLGFALGYSPTGMFKIIRENYPAANRYMTQSDVRLLLTGATISDSGLEKFVTLLVTNSPRYVHRLGHIRPLDITFADVYAFTRKDLIVNATDLETSKPRLFSSWTTPKCSVIKAVMASMSVIGYFRPHEIDGIRYIDGGFLSFYLPVMFDATNALYYKNIYPEVEIPVDLDVSWGILHQSTWTPPGHWSLLTLIKFLIPAIAFANTVSIMTQPHTFLKNRTWIVGDNVEITTFPSLSRILADFCTGQAQAVHHSLTHDEKNDTSRPVKAT